MTIRKLTPRPLVKPVLQANAKPPLKVPPKPGGLVVKRPAPASPAGPAGDAFAEAHRINAERERQAEIRRNQPMEFRMKVGEGGVEGVTLILTDIVRMPNMPFFHYYHRWGYQDGVPNSGKEDICIKDDPSGCPLCKKLGKEGGYEMVLTCIDGRPYTPKNGPNAGKTVNRSKKLLVVKTSMIPKFERLYKEHKTFRGMVVKMFRDNKKDTAIGSEIRFVKMLPESALKQYGDLAVPSDYKKAFPRPTYDELAARWGEATANQAAVGGSDFGGSDDSVPF